MSLLPIKSISRPRLVSDGAGVSINRAFAHEETELTDPFLMLDHLRNDNPESFMAGFPWHPHRGIETITYVLNGGVEHEDSLGNKGFLRSGDVQWMTAGSGIIHQEMPVDTDKGLLHGFQLWANLPAADKMTDPRYQDIPSTEIPEVFDDDGTHVRIITGTFWGKTGPVTGISTDPRYLDFDIPSNTSKSIKVNLDHSAFAYIFEGGGEFMESSTPTPVPTEYVDRTGISEAVPSHPVENRNLVLFDRGDELRIKSGPSGIRFLLVSGKPLKEPIAWHGPIVMNTEEELITAFREYREGNFLKHKS